MTNNTHRCIPLRLFCFENVSVDFILHCSSIRINGVSDLMRVSSFKVFHVLGVVDVAVTDASDLTVGSLVVFRQTLSSLGGSPVPLGLGLLLHS